MRHLALLGTIILLCGALRCDAAQQWDQQIEIHPFNDPHDEFCLAEPYRPFRPSTTDPVAVALGGDVLAFYATRAPPTPSIPGPAPPDPLGLRGPRPSGRDTACVCLPPVRNVTHRACARVVSYEQGIGENMTSLSQVRTHLASRAERLRVGPWGSDVDRTSVAQASLDEYRASETKMSWLRGHGALNKEMMLLVPKWFFGILNPSTKEGHFGIHFGVVFNNYDRMYPRSLRCFMKGFLSDYDFVAKLEADAEAAGQRVLCNGADFSNPNEPQDELYPKAQIELCVVAGPGSSFVLLLQRVIKTKRVVDFAQASITYPDGIVAPPGNPQFYLGMDGSCDEGHASSFENYVGAQLRLQVNPAKQRYEVVIVKGVWMGFYGSPDQGRLPPGRVIGSWPYK